MWVDTQDFEDMIDSSYFESYNHHPMHPRVLKNHEGYNNSRENFTDIKDNERKLHELVKQFICLGNNNALSERRNNDKFSTLNRIMNSKESKFSYDKAMIQKEMESKNESTKNTNFNVIGKLIYQNL